MTQGSLQPLSVGNVVTTGFQLYKNRFKPYFLLALKANAWFIVPIYGWAKFFALSALISRLVYGELVNQPETISAGTRYVNSKLWQFLIAGILIGLIVVGAFFAFAIAIGVAAVFAGLIGSQLGSLAVTAIASILAAIAAIVFIIGLLLLCMRFVIYDVPLAIEDNVDSSSTISRSWQLTKGFVGRILLVWFVAVLITLPLTAFVQFVSFAFQYASVTAGEQSSGINLLFYLLTIGLGILAGAIQTPFWQAIKAVIYYDLRTRKEGLGLKLRDRNI